MPDLEIVWELKDGPYDDVTIPQFHFTDVSGKCDSPWY